MICNVCKCPGAEVLVFRQACLNRRCYRFDRAHWRRFELAWANDLDRYAGDRVAAVVQWLANGAVACD